MLKLKFRILNAPRLAFQSGHVIILAWKNLGLEL